MKFFDGIEDNNAFCFVLEDGFRFVPAGEPGYRLYMGEAYPFVILADELRALNQYACETARAVQNYVGERENSFAEWEALPEDACDRLGCTKVELLLSCEQERALCDQLAWQAAGQLLCLLYSFLERALKRLRAELFAGEAPPLPRSRVRLYAELEGVFGSTMEDRFAGNRSCLHSWMACGGGATALCTIQPMPKQKQRSYRLPCHSCSRWSAQYCSSWNNRRRRGDCCDHVHRSDWCVR